MKEWIEEGVKEIGVTGLSGSARAYCLAGLLLELERPCLIVLPTAKEARKFMRELEFFLPKGWTTGEVGEHRLYSFPLYDISPLKGLSPHREIVSQRLEALYALASEKAPVVVTSAEAVALRILPKNEMMASVDLLQVGEEVDREKFLRKLDASGFQRTSLVEERGQFVSGCWQQENKKGSASKDWTLSVSCRNRAYRNSDMRVAIIRKFCKLDEAEEGLVRAAMSQIDLSARGYHCVLKLA